ncbi:Protein BIC2 [Euphorbia peplus]|nr:Protein BIC2 [Euphorbia peplus]
MESTSNNQESTALSSKTTRRILSFPARTRSDSALDLSSPKNDQVETIITPRNFLIYTSCSSPRQHSNDTKGKEITVVEKEEPRERLKRHREEVAGRVMIPDKWSQENLLRDWMDYTIFDDLLAPKGLASAREALMAEGRSRTSSQRLRIESRC